MEPVIEKAKDKSNEYNAVTIIAFVLSVVSAFGLGLLGWIGMILGIASLVDIKKDGSKGRGLAIAAITIGAVFGILKSVVNSLLQAGF